MQNKMTATKLLTMIAPPAVISCLIWLYLRPANFGEIMIWLMLSIIIFFIWRYNDYSG